MTSSVRRILKRGGARNFRKFERNMDQNLKLSYSNFVPFFAQNQVKSKKKKKGLHSNFVPFFSQNQVKSKEKKKRSSLKFRPIFSPKSGDFEPKALCPTCKGVGHASILLTFLCNYAILATQRGGYVPMSPPP